MQSVFFFVALRWAPRPFGGARAKKNKKNTTQGVFFLLRPRGKAREGEAPLEAGTGPEQKKTPPRVLFFLLRPRRKAREGEAPLEAGTGAKKKTPTRVFFFCSGGEGQGKEKPRWAPARGQSKKSFFFLLWPRAGAQRGFSFPCLSPGPEQKKNTLGGYFFFCSGPVPASNGASPSLAFRRGRSKKKHPGWCFFFALAPCRLPTGLLLPLPFAGAAAKKKKHPGWCFFFCCGPARTLTHSLRAWVAMPPPRRGGVFFFAAAPPGPGWCFFFAVAPPGRSLTHGGLGRFRQGPGGVFFFLLRPRRVFLDNSKKCLGYYIGSKKTRRGHSKKKKHHFPSKGSTRDSLRNL